MLEIRISSGRRRDGKTTAGLELLRLWPGAVLLTKNRDYAVSLGQLTPREAERVWGPQDDWVAQLRGREVTHVIHDTE